MATPGSNSMWTTTVTSETGSVVTEASALKFPAVWAAVQCIAGDVASLPFFQYRRLPNGGKAKYDTTRLYRVLHDEFNPEMTAMVGRETMTAHVLLWGNAYAEIVRNDLGQVVALYPIEPTRVVPERDLTTGLIRYRIAKLDGTEIVVPMERILHVVGLGWNGLMGYSVIGMMREALSVGLSAQQLGGQVMARGAKYSGFFEHPRTLGAQAHKNLKESIASDLPGTYRILEEGMVYKPGSMPLRDAQFMEIRQYSVTDTARIFGIPPHKLGDLTHATFSNIEEQNIDYVIGTLRRWLVRWEQECNRKLIAPLEKTLQFCEHLVDGLLRGNIQSRYSAYAQGIMNGYLSPNDIRNFENLDPIPGGDTYLVQGAMVPLARLDDIIDARIEPKVAPAPAPPPAPSNDGGPPTDTGPTRVIVKLVEDLRAELASRHAQLEGLPQRIVAALPEPPDASAPATAPEIPDVRPAMEALRTELLAVTTELVTTVTTRTESLPRILEAVTTPPPEPSPPIVAPVFDPALLEPMREAIDEAKQATTTLSARMATDADLQGWREATFALIAGRLVRRELAQLRKREEDPTEAVKRLEAFYHRFVGDAITELRPWLARLPEAPLRERAMRDVLMRWADGAMQTCVTAFQNGGLGDVVRRWEIDREAGLTRALMEAVNGG
jgi:HK97 family phage portal protein